MGGQTLWILVCVQTTPLRAFGGAHVTSITRRFLEHPLGREAGICRNARGTSPLLSNSTRMRLVVKICGSLFVYRQHQWVYLGVHTSPRPRDGFLSIPLAESRNICGVIRPWLP